MLNPVAGDLIEGSGGLRKLRFSDFRPSQRKARRTTRDLLLLDRGTGVLAIHPVR